MWGSGALTGTTVVTVTFKNIKTAKTTAKKYRCVVKAALEDKEPEKPVEEAKATKITEAKAASAKTISVTFDGVVDTSTATAIKVERGTTGITVAAKYADDKKSVLLTSDTSLAAGTYTVTVGTMTSDPFVVVKQTPTTMKITNTSIANQTYARVYFQVLDQYGEVMENYTDSKLEVSAYNVTKGHKIELNGASKKDYFILNCSTETVNATGSGISFLNAVGDKVSIVAYLKDNASVACNAELEIVRVYTDELTFGEVKLGDDKRVTVYKTYEIAYTAKDTEGKDVTFDEQTPNIGNTTPTTVSINNYNFISSNSSAVDMEQVSVDNNGRLIFVAGGNAGTAVITAINTITGKTSSITIVVNNTAQLSQVEIADAAVACNASFGPYGTSTATTFKAAVTAYDQFGEVIDPKNVKNIKFYNGSDYTNNTYFNSITPTPNGPIVLDKFTSDGKYVQYQVVQDLYTLGLKGQTVRFDLVSKEMGENGYVRSAAVVTVDDRIEASALEITSAPSATVSEDGTVSVQFAVKDQYQNKMSLTTTAGITGDANARAYAHDAVTGDTYVVTYEKTNNIITSCNIKDGDDSNVYKLEFKAPMITDLSQTGTFTLKLKDGGKVIASKMFNLIVVDSIDDYGVRTDKNKYKAGETITVTVDAYSDSKFNVNYNGSDVVEIQAAGKTYSKTLKFENGVATFELTAGTAGSGYSVDVKAKNKNAEGTYAHNASDNYEVVRSAAGKLAVDANLGKLRIYDTQGNTTTAWDRTLYATVKVTDENLKSDITGKVKIKTANGYWARQDDNTVAVKVDGNNIVTGVAIGTVLAGTYDYDYDFGTQLDIESVPETSRGHNLILSITVDGFTWESKIAYGSPVDNKADFEDKSSQDAQTAAQTFADSEANSIAELVTGTALTYDYSTASIATNTVVTTVSTTAIVIDATTTALEANPGVVTGSAVGTNFGIEVGEKSGSAWSLGDTITVTYQIMLTATKTTNNITRSANANKSYDVVYKCTNATGTGSWIVVSVDPAS